MSAGRESPQKNSQKQMMGRAEREREREEREEVEWRAADTTE